jgi:hypothetical protein
MPTTFPFGRVRPIMLRVVIASLVVAAVVAIVSIATASFGDTSWRLIGTAVLFTAFALFSWYDADVSSRRSTAFAVVSFAVSIYLFVAGMVKIWVPTRMLADPYGYVAWSAFDGFLGWVLLALIARVALLHVHLVLAIGARLRYAVMSVVTTATLVLVGTLATLLTLPVLFTWLDVHESYWRAVGVVAVLDALGTVLVPLGYQLFAGASPRGGSEGGTAQAGATSVPSEQQGGAWATGAPGPEVGSAASSTGFRPPSTAYARPGQRSLQWPRYDDGTLLPAGADGGPDFRGVIGYDDWTEQEQGRQHAQEHEQEQKQEREQAQEQGSVDRPL